MRAAQRAGAVLLAASFVAFGARAEERDLNALARQFLDQPAQRADIDLALHAKAARLPEMCPGVTFTQRELFVKTPPPPTFDGSGILTDGALRERFSSAGCGKFAPVFSVWVIAAPGRPLRTVASVPGTTRTYIDLQEAAIAVLTAAAHRAIPDCAELGVVDTKLIGFDTPADDPGGPFREDWLVGGCGKLAIVPLHFVPNKAAQATAVEVAGPLRPAELR